MFLLLRFDSERCSIHSKASGGFYLWYVMEKARLFLVREKRALATPLELGSHESVSPVSTATKSAGEKTGFKSASLSFHSVHAGSR